MHMIDGYGHDNNQFTEGAAATGIPATRVTADWLNAVQGELVAVVEAAGIALDKASNVQLLTAIRMLLTGRTGDTALVTSAPPDGWVVMDGGRIGSAASGATTRANADTEALFTAIWDALSDGDAPVQDSTGTPVGRGASAAADFAAVRRIVLNKPVTSPLGVIVKL